MTAKPAQMRSGDLSSASTWTAVACLGPGRRESGGAPACQLPGVLFSSPSVYGPRARSCASANGLSWEAHTSASVGRVRTRSAARQLQCADDPSWSTGIPAEWPLQYSWRARVWTSAILRSLSAHRLPPSLTLSLAISSKHLQSAYALDTFVSAWCETRRGLGSVT